MTGSVPILMYHQVRPRPTPAYARYSLTPQAFTRHMRILQGAGYQPISLDTLLDGRDGHERLPPRPVLITFDDAYQDTVTHAVPILQSFHFTATFFLVAGRMGKNSEWLRAEIGEDYPLIDWSTARQLLAAGFECGSHTVTHPRLALLDGETCRDELIRSRCMLEAGLGRAVKHLAYPFGSFNSCVREAAKEAGYASACSTRKRLSPPNDDRLALCRLPIYGTDRLYNFVSRLYTGQSVYGHLENGLRRVSKPLVRRR